MESFTGVPASTGIAIGKALIYTEGEIFEIPHYAVTAAEIPSEWERFQQAVSGAREEVKGLYKQARREMSRKPADIFQAHLMMLEDVDFHDHIKSDLEKNLCNIEWIVWNAARGISEKLTQSSDPLFRERASDVTDVARRVIDYLLPVTHNRSSLSKLNEDVILVAHDLMPSETLTMNKSRIKGIALDEGSDTSHTAIIARAFNIPAVLGLSDFSHKVKNGDTLVLNGISGTVIINPGQKILAREKAEEKKLREYSDELAVLRNLPAETSDGCRVNLNANIGLPEEAETALQYGAEGIGLYRTEFLFMTPGQAPQEEEQYKAYCRVLEAMGALPVTIRTQDLGGDKIVPELQTNPEKNPLLGWRAIRISIAKPEQFKIQLRALLRAGVHGNLRVMFPMISGIEELEQARALLDEARAECVKKKQPIAKNIEAGIMIEVPSAAMTADILAEKSAFFSIGTNDLVQYSLAADRGNNKVNYLSETHHPAILRFLKNIIDAAHARGIKAAMCGELAGDPSATAILLGMGLDEFSMTASSIPRIKKIIRATNLQSCQKLAAEVLSKKTIADVRARVQTWMAENGGV